MYVYVSICMYMYVHVCTCMYMYVHVCTCMYMYVHVCICMYMYVYVCICMYMYVYVCICLYMYGYNFVRAEKQSKQIQPVVLCVVPLPSSFISVSESIIFHLQRRKLQPVTNWRENDVI